jgi:hypothetical protein
MSSDHWLDRLAVLHTRRDTLRAVLATAATTLAPLVLRALPALAQGPHDCQKGCQWELMILRHKADSWDCSQPGCPHFDPKSPGAPCDSCRDHC